MADKEFNLLFEPWIMVMRPDGQIEEVSILDAFGGAHRFQRLAGELPTQDMAVMRLLLAILHAVFGRYNLCGTREPLCDADDDGELALTRWKEMYDRGEFLMSVIKEYLTRFEERFFLYHTDYPFYQVSELGAATEYSAAKLNGELSESANKIRLFPQRSGDMKNTLINSEAARWLLYVNAFDDTSSKPKTKGLDSPGVGWMGKLGLVCCVGQNLFETLMLNLVFLKDGSEYWGEERPIWERETVKRDERTKISLPDNQSELLTLQSRRLLLRREGKHVIGYSLLGGDFFDPQNAFAEQMTLWRNTAKKEKDPDVFMPRRHDPERYLWQDFSALAVQSKQSRRPGIVSWMSELVIQEMIPPSLIRIQTAAVKYGDKDFFIDDVFSDDISMNATLLHDIDASWIGRILDAIRISGLLAEQVGRLAQNIAKAAGRSDEKSLSEAKQRAKREAYYRMDLPFRAWLETINPVTKTTDVSKGEASTSWWEAAQRIARSLGEEYVRQSGVNALVGRTVVENKIEKRYSAPEAFNWFLYNTASPQSLEGRKKDGKQDKFSR